MTALAAGAAPIHAMKGESPGGCDQARTGHQVAIGVRRCPAYQIGPVAVALQSDEVHLLDDFHALYARYAVPIAPQSVLHVEVVRRRSPRTWRRTYHIGVDGEERFVVASPRAVLPHVEWAINAAAVSTLPGFFQIHAAVVARGGAALMLPAAPQSGKSTLAAALIQRGWRYLSDEFALIDPATLHVFAFPKALCIKHGSFERIARLGVTFSSDRDYLKGVKGRVRFIDPNQFGPGAVGDPVPVRWIVFPVAVGLAVPRLEPLTRARAAYEMTRLSFTLTRFRGRSLDVLAALASQAECFNLHGGELTETCDAIEACVGGTEATRIPARGPTIRNPSSAIRNSSDGLGSAQKPARSPKDIMEGVAACLMGQADGAVRRWQELGLWDRAACLACDEGLGGFLAEALHQQGLCVPQSAAETLAAYRDHVAALNDYQATRMRPVFDALRQAGVEFLVLKGAALNVSLYRRPDLRGMSDFDLLIHPTDLHLAEAALTDAGCRAGRDGVRPGFFPRFYYEREYLTAHRPPVRVDLHVRPFRPIRYADTVPADAMWDEPERAVVGDATILIPNRENMLIHLCVHAACHGLVQLRWIHDIHAFVEAYGESLNWDEVETKAKAWRVNLPMRRALESVQATFGPDGGVINRVITRFDAPVTILDRLALWQSPHDARRPVRHVLTDVLCIGGLRARWDYLAAMLLPDRTHMAQWYGGRHRGWRAAAHALRLLRPLFGIANNELRITNCN